MNDNVPNDATVDVPRDTLDRLRAVLEEFVAELDEVIAEGSTSTAPAEGTHNLRTPGTAWERHDDPEQQL